jgi:hypothetical protein
MDNRYFKNECPPLMQDGRFITNYMESRVVEQFIRNVNEIQSAQEYRHFLQQNGDTIINRERAYYEKMNTCDVQGRCVPLSTSSNYIVTSNCGCACKR